MYDYAAESIDRYERSMLADPHNPKPTLFTKVFNAKEETMSREELLANAETYIIAGSDTTAHSMTYLVWAVCRHADVKGKLVSEVAGLPEVYSDEDLKALPYLNQVIHETLRLYASAPGYLPREVPPNGTEIDGYWMPGGTEVQTQAYSMHRNPAVYPNPER
jgi:cytochrome P450